MKKTEIQDNEVRTKVVGFLRDVQDSNMLGKIKKRAQLHQDFFAGGKRQWTQEEYNLYKSKGVTPVTINRCRPVIKSLCGMMLDNRQDIKVRPRRKGTETVAGIYSEIIKHAIDESNGEHKFFSCYKRGAIDTMAFLEVENDKEKNINGQPIVNVLPLEQVDWDTSAIEYDLDISAKFIVVKKWMDKEVIHARYPDIDFDSLTSDDNVDYGDSDMGNTNKLVENLFGNDFDEGHEDSFFDDDDTRTKSRYFIRKVYWKEILPGLLVLDKQEKRQKVVSDTATMSKIKRLAKKSDRYDVIPLEKKRLHKTMMLGSKMLSDEPDPFGEDVNTFPVFRFAPYFEEVSGESSGAIDDAISLNREENVHRTQIIRLLNQTANSGWMVGEQGNAKALALLKEYGSVEGVVIDKSKFGGYVEKIVPNTLPTGIFANADKYELDIKRVTGVDDATLGLETGKAESGRAIGLKQQQNLKSASPAFANFYETVAAVGRFLLSYIRSTDVYTQEEIISIVSESSLLDSKLLRDVEMRFTAQIGGELPEPQMMQPIPPETMAMIPMAMKPKVMETVRVGQQASLMYMKKYPYLREEMDKIIKNAAVLELLEQMKQETTATYGVKVTISPSAPTAKLAKFMEMDAMMQQYPGIIPPEIYIDASDLPNKDEIKNKMQQANAMQQQKQKVGAA